MPFSMLHFVNTGYSWHYIRVQEKFEMLTLYGRDASAMDRFNIKNSQEKLTKKFILGIFNFAFVIKLQLLSFSHTAL